MHDWYVIFSSVLPGRQPLINDSHPDGMHANVQLRGLRHGVIVAMPRDSRQLGTHCATRIVGLYRDSTNVSLM